MLYNDSKKQRQEEIKKQEKHESGHFEEPFNKAFLEALAKTV